MSNVERGEDFSDGTYVRQEGIVITDSTGHYAIDIQSLPQTITYNGPGGAIDTITITDLKGNVFKQTLTYTGSNVTSISAWVKQ